MRVYWDSSSNGKVGMPDAATRAIPVVQSANDIASVAATRRSLRWINGLPGFSVPGVQNFYAGRRGFGFDNTRTMAMHITSDQPWAEANSSFLQRAPCEPKRITRALGVAMLACLPMSWAGAKCPEAKGFGMHMSAHEALSRNGESPLVDLSLMPITVEGEDSYPDSTPDDSMRKFRDALGPPRVLAASERKFRDGAMELTTRFGHFCARSLPAYLQTANGDSIALTARCVGY